MFKNKKIVLSSIAIIFALVVCSIFVNYTLANSDSQASTAGQGSGSKTTSLTGLTNIDLAVINSNDSTKKASGEDKFRIVQIVPDQRKDIAEMDTALTSKLQKQDAETVVKNLSDEDYAKTSYLWRYVYNGEYFRLAVFDGYKTVDSNMAEGAVTLTTCTVSQLNKMDATAQGILNQADFIYIWADAATGASSYASSDISEDLYNWLDAYTTVNSHPLGICTAALCTDEPAAIVGNNDTYRMGAFAYKIMTKGAVARFDNILVTEADFFQKLFKEADDNKENPDNPSTTNTISDFLLKASKSVNDEGYGFLTDGKNTYFKWYNVGNDAVSIEDFTDRKPAGASDTAYLRVGMAADKMGLTTKRKSWDFDNAKILVISENGNKTMFSELSGKNTAPDNSPSAMADTYKKSANSGDKVIVWKAEEKAKNSDLTGTLYSGGKDGSNAYVPSGAEIHLITPENLEASMRDGSKGLIETSIAGSFYKDVTTKTVSGTVSTADAANVDLDSIKLYANLLVNDGTSVYLTDKYCEIVKKTVSKRDEDGNEILDDDGKPVTENVYSYEFAGLNPDYDYSVVIESYDGFDDTSSHPALRAGVAVSNGQHVSQYDFTLGLADSPADQGYTYREDKSGTDVVVDLNTVVTINDFNDNADLTADLDADPALTSEMTGRYYDSSAAGVADRLTEMNLDLSVAANVVTYVTKKHDVYSDAQRKLTDPYQINLEDYDFIFIDQGMYNTEIDRIVTDGLKSAVEKGIYMIVSSSAGDGKGSGGGSGTNPGGKPIPVVTSPSAKVVADVINASVYREGSDNKFKVLEIQPDYPIDLDVASRNADTTTAYTNRSDGTAITGDYYTIPSDVITGKSKEELDEQTEYYQFDLTKAKIAYAIDGVSYGDIQLTQVSTEQLIGMKEDIAATYDLVYIGGDISALDRDPSQMYRNQKQVGSYSSEIYSFFPTFIMYYHTGMLNKVSEAAAYSMDTSATGSRLMATPVIGSTVYNTAYIPENGNDITETKYDELLNYVSSGRPVMVSDELTSVYENMQGTNASGEKLSQIQLLQGYWYNNGKLERKNYYLDPSSRMYKLMGNIYTKKNSGKSANILWGCDIENTKYISDADGVYGSGLYTAYVDGDSKQILKDESAKNESWYGDSDSGKVFYNYKVVFGDSINTQINDLIKKSAGRTRLTVISKPVTYQEGIESTYIKSNRLTFKFQVDGSADSYGYILYVDKDKNTVFDDQDYMFSGTAKSGEEVTQVVALDAEFFGSASWYLVVKDADGNVAASTSGLSKIVNNNNRAEINVLQIQTMSEGQDSSTWTSRDTLYFDITSQMAHKICKYNVYANQTEYDNAMAHQYKALGRHENRFGIYEYDMSTDSDDFFSNLADTLTSDYDINLDMVVASADRASFKTADGTDSSYDCIDTMVEEAETLEAGGKVDGFSKDEYAGKVEAALTAYTTASAKVVAPKKRLDDYLKGAITVIENNGSSVGDATYGSRSTYRSFLNGFNDNSSDSDIVDLLNMAIKYSDYSMMVWPVFSKNSDIFENGEIGLVYGKDFRDYFIAYRKAKDAELEARDTYYKYLRRSYGKNFLKNMYSILVLGPSDSFGGFKVDLKEKTCEYILDYVSNGGDLFFFHDSMTPFADAGAVNLTKSLLSIVGMNRFHVDLTDNANSYTVSNDGYATGFYSAGLVKGKLSSDGDIYIPQKIQSGLVYKSNISAGETYYTKESVENTPDGLVWMKLSKEDYIYDYWYNHQNDSSWENVGKTYIVSDQYGDKMAMSDQDMVRKKQPAGTTGFAMRAAQTNEKFEKYVDQYGNINNNGFFSSHTAVGGEKGYVKVEAEKYTYYDNATSTTSNTGYFSKEKANAGTEGYIWRNAGAIFGNGTSTSLEYKATDKYYMTPYAFNNTNGKGLINSINSNYSDWLAITGASSQGKVSKDAGIYVSAVAMSALYQNGNDHSATTALPYVYAQEQFQSATAWSMAGNADESACSETVKASQLNKGLVTLYPYNISSTLNISGTHQQAYALDLESNKVTVWYTLAGSNNSNSPKTRSSRYAASPGDAMESYFIYTTAYGKGAVTYCGAGHSSVTGRKTRNNDERKLFINVIVNSAAAVPDMPEIKCYQPTNSFEADDELPKDEEALANAGKKVYQRDVDSKTDTPTFDLKVVIPENTKISRVKVFYDLDYFDADGNVDYTITPSFDDSTTDADGKTKEPDVLIEEYTSVGDKSLTEVTNELKENLRTDNGALPNLPLQDKYFAPYGGGYTFIVVQVFYQGKTEPVYAMIKIKASDPLFNLTQNIIDTPVIGDYVAEKKYICG